MVGSKGEDKLGSSVAVACGRVACQRPSALVSMCRRMGSSQPLPALGRLTGPNCERYRWRDPVGIIPSDVSTLLTVRAMLQPVAGPCAPA